jgi:hypothetical protein
MWDAGDDVYLCEYMYDASWQRFRRCEEQDKMGGGAEGMEMEELVWDEADEQADARGHDDDDDEFELEAEDDAPKKGAAAKSKRRQSIKQAGKAQKGAMNRYVVAGAGVGGEKSNKRQKVIAPPAESLEAAFEVFGKRKNILSMGLAQVPEGRRRRQEEGPLAQVSTSSLPLPAAIIREGRALEEATRAIAPCITHHSWSSSHARHPTHAEGCTNVR